MTSEPNSQFKILSHPTRREILKYIQKNSPVSFTQLNERFKLEVGTLYYHLGIMKRLIQQDKERSYYLTDEGKIAYQLAIEKPYPDMVDSAQPITRFRRFLSVFLFIPLIEYLRRNPKRSTLEGVAISLLYTMIAFFLNYQPELLFYTISEGNTPLIVPLLGVFIRWLYIYAVAQSISRWLFDRKDNPQQLFSVLPFCLLPLSLYPVLITIINTISQSYHIILDLIVQLVLQLWTLGSIANALARIKTLRNERAGFIVLLIHYFNVLLIWLIVFFF